MRILSILAGGMALSSIVANAGDWPRFRGPEFTGISSEKDFIGKWDGGAPKTLWKKNVGIGFSSMAVANGQVFTMGHADKQDSVYAFDAVSGAQVWKFSYPQDLAPKYYEGGPSATPTVDGGRVYTLSKGGLALCLEAATGKVIWKVDTHGGKEFGCELPEWGFAGSVHIEGDLAILNVGTHGLALKKSTGEKVWLSGKDAAGYATPVPFMNGGKRVLAMFTANSVVAVDPSTGKALWSFPWKTQYDVNASDPVVGGDLMYLTSGYGTGGVVIRFTANSAKQVWTNKSLKGHMASPILIGQHLYGIDDTTGEKSQLRCLELSTGKVLWSSPEVPKGALAAADGKLIWMTGSGELVIVEAKPDAYKEIVRSQISGGKVWAAPVLSNGKLYVRNAKGDVVCVDLKGSGPVS